MLFLSRVTLIAIYVFLTACSSIDIEVKDYDRPESYVTTPRLSTGQPIKVKRIWSANVGSVNDQEFIKLLPAVTENEIYSVSARGHVKAWSKVKHKKLWHKKLDENITGGIFAGYGQILIGSSDGAVIALNSENGDVVWRQELSGEILAPPQGNGRYVVVQLANGTLHGLDFKTGENKWVYKTPVPPLTLRGTSIPQIEKQLVFAGFANGRVVALDIITGMALWETSIYLPEGGTELEQVVDVDGDIVIDTNSIYAASYQGRVVSLFKQNGRALWKNNASNYLGLEKGLGQIYSIEEDGMVRAYHSDSGDLVWEQAFLKGRQLSAPATQLNYLVVGDLEGYLYWIRQSDGEVVARKLLGRGSISSPHRWNFKGLRNKAENKTDFRVFSKPVVKDGILYVQNQYGALVAYQIIE
jgi:outer membrane protein assembly factor BamB